MVALSADPEAEPQATVEEHGIEFPVAHGLEPERMSQTMGVYLGGEAEFVQATGFILSPRREGQAGRVLERCCGTPGRRRRARTDRIRQEASSTDPRVEAMDTSPRSARAFGEGRPRSTDGPGPKRSRVNGHPFAGSKGVDYPAQGDPRSVR